MKQIILAVSCMSLIATGAIAKPVYRNSLVGGYAVAQVDVQRVTYDELNPVVEAICQNPPSFLSESKDGQLVIVNRFGAQGWTVENASATCRELVAEGSNPSRSRFGTPWTIVVNLIAGLPKPYGSANPFPLPHHFD